MRKIFVILIASIQINLCLAQFQEKPFPNIPNLNNSKCAWGDLNSDGQQDLVLMGEQPDKYITSVYINNTDHFSQMIIPELKALSNGSLSLMDFNNDNHLDIFYTGNDKEGNKHTLLFKNIEGNSFSKVTTSFENVNLSSHTWLDFNNDGFIDLILSGLDSKSQIITKTYINNKNEGFDIQELNLSNIYSGNTKSVDYNKDGWTDLLLTGKSEGSNRICHLYKNNEGRSFDKVIEFDGLSKGDSEWGDINNDGFPDLALAGYNGLNYTAKIYTNIDGTFQFSQDLTPPLGGCDMEWIDYDGDEDLDLICIGGVKNTSPQTILYTNNNAVFTNSNASISNLFTGCIGVVDFNNDGKTDIFLSGVRIPEGPKSFFYLNNNSFTYEIPTAPTSLISDTNYPNILLKWNNGGDDLTSPISLKYRLKLGTTEENSGMFPFYTDLNSNNNLLISKSEILSNRITLKDLPEGKYYWAVQSVDLAGNISTLSDSQSFFINSPINLGEDIDACNKEQVKLSVPNGNYTANWFTKSEGQIASNTNTISLSITKDETVWIELNKDYGGIVKDTIKITHHNAPELDLLNEVYICPNTSITITPISNATSWEWKNFDDATISNETTYNFDGIKKDSLILEVKSDYSCLSRDTCYIYLHENPIINLEKVYFACKNEFVTIQTDDYYKIQWLSEEKEVISKNTSTLRYNVDRESRLYLKVENKETCSSEQSFALIPHPSLLADAGKDTLICEGSDIAIGPEVLANGGKSPYSYNWISNDETISTVEKHPIFNAEKTTEFILKVTDSNGCIAQDTTTYTINPTTIVDAGIDKSICYGESIVLGGEPTAQNSLKSYKYKWAPTSGLGNPDIANPVASPIISTEYTLSVTTHNCESISAKVNIDIHETPNLTIISDTTVGSNQDFTLWARGANNYEWSPEGLLDNPTSNNPKTKIKETTIFSVLGYSEFGCQSSEQQIIVNVNNEIYVPTLFSPNNDSKNDKFLIYGTGISDLRIRIYNSWGRVIFKSNDVYEIQKTGWDGTTSGNKAPEGSYIWELEGIYSDGRYWKKTGTIYLMR